MKEEWTGLSWQEVKARQGETPSCVRPITKPVSRIIKDNVCTLFNALNFGIAAILIGIKAYSNALFIGIIALNILIGIIQEIKAKKCVDQLSILNQVKVCVLREGKRCQVAQEEVVKGDLMILESGNQICNDAIILDGALEVDEALLSGESDPVFKGIQAELLSGSTVISGKALAKVSNVGMENYATRLTDEVKKEKQVYSELLHSMNKVTHFTSFLIVPLGILLLAEAVLLRNEDINAAIIASAAALLGMLPKGLVLLISVSLAVGVIRLSKMKILVQDIYSLESLAHVDTLCLDKTGTLTNGELHVHAVIPFSAYAHQHMDALIASYMYHCDDNNATFQALKTLFHPDPAYAPDFKRAFSSQRKWGAMYFRGEGSIYVGAPDILLKRMPQELEVMMEKGYRCVLIAYSPEKADDEHLPDVCIPCYGVVLENTIRPKVAETLSFFKAQGVDVKIISGDHIKTVQQIALQAGLSAWRDAADLSAFHEAIDYDALVRKYSVFARVTPRQKQELVKAYQRQGHHMAMTGDGVNDLLALREAECSIAMADGSDAVRQISQIVLLESDFTHLPQVVQEGRKVINNVTRTAQVFFIKTFYSMLVSLFCLLCDQPFPFIPIQITLIDALIEAYPSFLSVIEADARPLRGSFLSTALRNAAPFAVVIFLMIVVITLLHPFSDSQNQTMMYILLIMISMTAVFKSCFPLTKLRVFVCVTMVCGIALALYLFPTMFNIVPFDGNMVFFTVWILMIAILIEAAEIIWINID